MTEKPAPDVVEASIRRHIPMDYLERHGADTVAAMRDYAEDRWKLIERLKTLQARPDARTHDDTLEEAAKLVECRMEQRFEEHGTRDWDTNTTYYEGAAAGIYESLDEEDEAIAQAIRNLKGKDRT